MRKKINNPKVKFYIGNVRDKRSVDYIFHTTALKKVLSCEFSPIEAVNTNVIVTENVLDSALEHGVKLIIVLSTNKAVYCINAKGITKAMMGKVMQAKARSLDYDADTVVCGTFYGNVMPSRGSVIPF